VPRLADSREEKDKEEAEEMTSGDSKNSSKQSYSTFSHQKPLNTHRKYLEPQGHM